MKVGRTICKASRPKASKKTRQRVNSPACPKHNDLLAFSPCSKGEIEGATWHLIPLRHPAFYEMCYCTYK